MFNPTSPAFLANPYPTYARLREQQPIFFYKGWQKWIITRHHDVNTLLRDKRLGRVIHHVTPPEDLPPANPAHAPFDAIQAGSLLEIEPPDHTRIRQVVHAVFTPKHVREMQTTITRLCQTLADKLEQIPARQANLIKDFAEPIPVTVIADLLGVPEADRHNLLPWSKAIIGMFEPERTIEDEQRAVAAAQAFSDYVRHLMHTKQQNPQEDLISRMVAANQKDPDSITENEIIANCILFLNAGHEAVVNVIGNGVAALLTHPEQLAILKQNPDLMPTAIEEMLRYDTPLQFFERYVLEDMTYEGHHWPKGSKLCLYYSSANHDAAVFEHPEKFDVTRTHNPHIAFGLGLHYCIGAPLARLELNAALSTLLTRFPDLRLDTTTLAYVPKNVFRYLTALPVKY